MNKVDIIINYHGDEIDLQNKLGILSKWQNIRVRCIIISYSGIGDCEKLPNYFLYNCLEIYVINNVEAKNDALTSEMFALFTFDDELLERSIARAARAMTRDATVCAYYAHSADEEVGAGADRSAGEGPPDEMAMSGDHVAETIFRRASIEPGRDVVVGRTCYMSRADQDYVLGGDATGAGVCLRLGRAGPVVEVVATGHRPRRRIEEAPDLLGELDRRLATCRDYFRARGSRPLASGLTYRAAKDAILTRALDDAEALVRRGDGDQARAVRRRVLSENPLSPIRHRYQRKMWPFRRWLTWRLRMEAHLPALCGTAPSAWSRFSGGELPRRVDIERPLGHGGAKWAACRIQAAIPRGTSHLVVAPWLKRGGADLVVLRHLRFLLDAGCRPALVLTSDEHSPWLSKVPRDVPVAAAGDVLVCLPERERAEALALAALGTDASALHVIQSPEAWLSIGHHGAALRRRMDVYVSLYLDDIDQRGRPVGFARYYMRKAKPFLSGCIFDNQTYLSHVAETYGLERDMMRVAYVSTPRAEISCGYGSPRVLWAGRLVRQKRPEILLEVARRMPHLHFDVYGAASGAPDGVAADLARQDNVSFKGIYDDFGSIPTSQYGCFLYTSGYDGLPNVLLEAGARGMAVVASDVGGVAELITDATGWLVSSSDVSAYVEAVEAAMDPNASRLRGSNLLELVRSRHSEQAFADAMRSVRGYLPTAQGWHRRVPT